MFLNWLKRIILVINEYPYIAKASKSLASTLQSLIDKNKDTSNLFLILCGSSMSFMENHVLAYKAPLYGRRTAQFKILPFDFFESRSYFKKFSDMDMAVVYGIVGGTPQYLLQMNDNLSLEENIKHCFLEPSNPLFEEPNNLLKQEVREPAIYNAIITAIATGSTKLSKISSKVGEETSACAAYIKNLISLGIIKKRHHLLKAPQERRSIKLTITYFAFGIVLFFNRKFLLSGESGIKKPAKSGHRKQTVLLEDIKTFFKFIVIKVIILNKEIMHVEQIGISHIPDKPGSHSFRRIFDIFLPGFP